MASSNSSSGATATDASSFACGDLDAKTKDDEDADNRPYTTPDADVAHQMFSSSAKPSMFSNPLRSSSIDSLTSDISTSALSHDFSSRMLSTSISTSTVSSLLSSQSPSSTFGIASAQFQIGSPTGAFAQKKKPVKPKKDGPLFHLLGTSQKRSLYVTPFYFSLSLRILCQFIPITVFLASSFPGRPRPRSRKTQLGFGMSPKPFANLQASLSGELQGMPEAPPISVPSEAPSEAMHSPGADVDKASSDVTLDTPDSDNSMSGMNFEKCVGDESFSEQWQVYSFPAPPF